MIYKMIFAPQFEKDIDRTFKYISCNLSSPQAAKKLMANIDKSITLAAENPYMYPLCPERLSILGLRKIVIDNYIAVYTVNENYKSVQFLNLFFGGQNYVDFFVSPNKF